MAPLLLEVRKPAPNDPALLNAPRRICLPVFFPVTTPLMRCNEESRATALIGIVVPFGR
jgi:hypothetical protein